jgi:hypothetical protein
MSRKNSCESVEFLNEEFSREIHDLQDKCAELRASVSANESAMFSQELSMRLDVLNNEIEGLYTAPRKA